MIRHLDPVGLPKPVEYPPCSVPDCPFDAATECTEHPRCPQRIKRIDARTHAMNAELPAETRDVLILKGMI